MKKTYDKKHRPIKASNAIYSTAPTSVWGYKGCAGKGGRTTNFCIPEKKD